MNKAEINLYQNVTNLLLQNKLVIKQLESKLKINYIRGSGKWWQKRNKTSSTVQLIDSFNYLNYIPTLNKNRYKWLIVIKMNQGRSQQSNYNYAIMEWLKTLKNLFFVSKARTINQSIENKRKKAISKIYKDIKQNEKYRNRFE